MSRVYYLRIQFSTDKYSVQVNQKGMMKQNSDSDLVIVTLSPESDHKKTTLTSTFLNDDAGV